MRKFPLNIILTLLVLYIVVLPTTATWDLRFRKRLPSPLINPPHLRHERRLGDNLDAIKKWLSYQQQPLAAAAEMGSNPSSNAVLPPVSSGDGGDGRKSDGVIVSDVLPKTKGVNIFASLTRQFESVEARLDDAARNVTVLAPRNSAIQDLPRKPWENPDDYERFGEANAYAGQDGQDRATRNLERFVKAHVVVKSPWPEGEEAETLAGDRLTWSRVGDKIRIQPGDVEVDSIAEKVSNGEVWVLNGVINYR
ncbi:uncharacterized protein BO97DRAFT_373779 [Aspergillus homomorphus CBS 101889]|uniref:FAS1 domain-containing protein n=1 Tax=Aspergillus homomorphus (strain CBS 101889) TaxID=1450537 RepID=A0A395HSG5_ASPHC|nr:hypothetical protein BO97DRAFT_373779 [Aspergillus homomorphus CBS 101889]RAL09798.1 hypothetical protein BO97DRAFT_373779 [Aspergillus homomorphus CBS 101889]